jgi:type IV secretion system protein VirD4
MVSKFFFSLLQDMSNKKRDTLLYFLALCGFCYVVYRFFVPIINLLHIEGNKTMVCLLGFIFLSVLAILCLIAVVAAKNKPLSTSTHGTAHFATPEESRPFYPSLEEINDAPWLVVGKSRHGVAALSPIQQESHVLMVAPSGQGKTSGVIIPNLLRETGNRSLFINDIKFELIQTCAGWLGQRYHCLFLTPTKPTTSHHYNPLAHVENMKDAQQLAACLVKNTGESQEAFWNNVAELLLTASILHLKEVNVHAPFSALVHLLLTTPLDELKQQLLTSPSVLARSVSTSLLNNLARNDRLAGSIMVELAARLYSMAEPNITQVTNQDDIDFNAFITTPTAIFIAVHPSEAEDLRWFTAAFTMQLMKHLSKTAEQSAKRRLPRPVSLYLDEFGNHYIPNFPDYISLVRSAGISILMALQNLSQIETRYGEGAKDTILANASTHIIFPGCGLPECMYYSERLGDATVETLSKSEQGVNLSLSHSNAARRLMTPDEIRRMPQNWLLLISSNHAPFRVINTPYFRDKNLITRASLPYNLPYRAAPTLILPPTTTPPSQAQPLGPFTQPQGPNTSNNVFLP